MSASAATPPGLAVVRPDAAAAAQLLVAPGGDAAAIARVKPFLEAHGRLLPTLDTPDKVSTSLRWQHMHHALHKWLWLTKQPPVTVHRQCSLVYFTCSLVVDTPAHVSPVQTWERADRTSGKFETH